MVGTAEVYVPTTKDYLDVIFRRRWPYVLGFVVGILLVLFMQSQQLATYRSESLIFVHERSKSTTFVAGLSQTSSFAARWPNIQNYIFNLSTINRHLKLFSGESAYVPPREGSLEEDRLNDQSRYTMTRRVPYDLHHDRLVTLTPYQWWMIRHILDEWGWVPPKSESETQREIKERARIAHWFWVNIFNPMEQGQGWPIVNGDMALGPSRNPNPVDSADERLGEILPIDKSLITERDLRYFQQHATGGQFARDDVDPSFLRDTSLTHRDIALLNSKGFVRSIEENMARALIPNGFKVAFTWSNPRLTRFAVAWTVEMIFRFNDDYQYKEIFESQDLLRRKLDDALESYAIVQNKVSRFLEENVEKYESAMAQYILNPEQAKFPTVSQYQPPESVVRASYSRIIKDLERDESRLKQARVEIETVRRQLESEQPTISRNLTQANPVYAKFQSRLAQLKNTREEELFTKTSRHPHVVDLTRRILAIQKTLGNLEKNTLSERSTEVNPRFFDLKEELDGLEIEIASLQTGVENLKVRRELMREELRKVPIVEQRILLLKSELQERQGVVNQLQARINSAKTEEEFTYDLAKVEYTIKVMPTRPDMPQDKLWIHIGMAFILFIFISGVTIFLCEFLDVTIKEINDVNRYLDANVIGIIPKIPQEAIETEKKFTQDDDRGSKGRGKMKLFNLKRFFQKKDQKA